MSPEVKVFLAMNVALNHLQEDDNAITLEQALHFLEKFDVTLNKINSGEAFQTNAGYTIAEGENTVVVAQQMLDERFSPQPGGVN